MMRTKRYEVRGLRTLLETVPQDSASSFIDRTQLVKLRLKAMRAGVWFRALRRIDRALIDLTIKVVGNVRSVTLARSIFSFVRKLDGIMESCLSRAVREAGLPLAQKLSLTAQKWGSTSAKSWAFDLSFVNFLAVMCINDPKTFKP